MVSAALVVVAATAGCRRAHDSGAARSSTTAAARASDEDRGEGRFYARWPGGKVGAPLSLTHLAVQVRLAPGVVRTRLVIEVATTIKEQVEAIMRLSVPPGAAVTGGALWVEGRAVPGTLAARDRATEIYRGIVNRRRDPALVAWAGPGSISVSIFPVDAAHPRRLELEWSEPAGIREGLVHLRVPAVVERDQVLGRPSVIDVDGRSVPVRDLDVLPIAQAADVSFVAARAPGDPFHQLLLAGGPPASPPKLVLVAETSAALAAAGRLRQRELLNGIVHGLPATAQVTLMAADWRSEVIADALSPDKLDQPLERLDAIPSAGALDLERMLLDAAERARASGAAAIVFAGVARDGFRGDALGEPIRRLREDGIRLHVFAVDQAPGGPVVDGAALTGGEAAPASWLEATLSRVIASARPRPPRPAIMPRGLDAWHPLETIFGDTVWIGRALDVSEQKTESGAAVPVRGHAPAMLALWDRARLGYDPLGRGAREQDVVAAVAPLQALLVLESAQEYESHGLRAPAPWADAIAPALVATEAQRSAAYGELHSVFGADRALGDNGAENLLGNLVGNEVGGVGLVGTGTGGGGTGEGTVGLGAFGTIGKSGAGGAGRGYGRAAGRRNASAADVIAGQASIRGALDKEIVRRIMRRHIHEVRSCYQQELVRRPDLGGRIMVQLSVAGTGRVIAAVLQSSTLGNAGLESCIVNAARGWEFPKPAGGGLVIVSYPFVLAPTHGAEMQGPRPVDAALSPGPVQRSLAVLDEKVDLADRVRRIAAEMNLTPTTDPERIAWVLDRRHASRDSLVLIARLLRTAGRDSDARRILSEGAIGYPTDIADEFRRIGATADADRLLRLQERSLRSAGR